jgi:hypothetical protein
VPELIVLCATALDGVCGGKNEQAGKAVTDSMWFVIGEVKMILQSARGEPCLAGCPSSDQYPNH